MEQVGINGKLNILKPKDGRNSKIQSSTYLLYVLESYYYLNEK